MPKTAPLPDWHNEDAFCIGGGQSLATFDWQRLRGLNTIGCNQAFLLGADICNICVFGDFRFWQACQPPPFGFPNGPFFDIATYEGWVATNYITMNPPPWLHFFERQDQGLSRTGLAWNNNTGALAVNLALKLGAKRVYLLGYDMHRTPDKAHWHDKEIEHPVDEVYQKFIRGFEDLAHVLPAVYPGCEIINVTDGSSKLMRFPRVSLDEAFTVQA